MSDIDKFARQLLEEAKRFFEKARVGNSDESTYAFLHAALMLGFCAFEAHINSVADDFIVRDDLNVLERALLSERDTKLDDGEFTIAPGLKIYRLTDRIEFIFRRFSGSPIDKSEKWWGDLKTALVTRNELTHPKQQAKVNILAVESALKAIIQSLDALYRAVYKKPYPPGPRGLDSTMTF